jgi:hypothetical protein
VSRTPKFPNSDREQRRCTANLEPFGRNHSADYVNEHDNQGDGERVPKGDRQKRY